MLRAPLVILVALHVGCTAPDRDPLVVQSIVQGEVGYLAERDADRERALARIMARADAVANGETGDDSLDVLLLSGGADWGAFGAGYLAAWSELGEDAAEPMPEFDAIGGISTGALIGTYTIAGTPERYRDIESFYRNTRPDWVRFGGLRRFLPRNAALLDSDGIREEVAAAVDDALLAELREARAQNRVLFIGTTNLDYGQLQYWELGEQAAMADDPKARIVDILVAATAIPGLFAPVEIDDHIHADGGAVTGVPAFEARDMPAFVATWRARHGERPMPRIRTWWIFNNQLNLHPDPVRMSWIEVMQRSYQTISQTAFKAPLEASVLAASRPPAAGSPAFELRWVAIPRTYEPDARATPFDPAVTNVLADLGREVARRPDGGWRQDYPD